jgi:hypothetical protein
MAAFNQILGKLPGNFDGRLLENGVLTTTRISYHSELGFKVEGLLEELPPSLSLRWGPQLQPLPNGFPHNDAENLAEFDFFKMLDPRIVFSRQLNEGLEVTSSETNPHGRGGIFVASYKVRDLGVPNHLVEWLEKFGESRRPVVLVADGNNMIRAMSQMDIPPSPSIVTLFFSYPNEQVDWELVTLVSSISISKIQTQRFRSGVAQNDR